MLFTFLSGTACQAWRVQPVAPESLLAADQPERVRVTRVDGSHIVLEHPVVRADTVSGSVLRNGVQQDIRIPLTDVRHIETRGFSTSRTVGLGLGVTAGLFAALLLVITLGNAAGN